MLHRIAVRYSLCWLFKTGGLTSQSSWDNYMFEIISRAFQVHLNDSRRNWFFFFPPLPLRLSLVYSRRALIQTKTSTAAPDHPCYLNPNTDFFFFCSCEWKGRRNFLMTCFCCGFFVSRASALHGDVLCGLLGDGAVCDGGHCQRLAGG